MTLHAQWVTGPTERPGNWFAAINLPSNAVLFSKPVANIKLFKVDKQDPLPQPELGGRCLWIWSDSYLRCPPIEGYRHCVEILRTYNTGGAHFWELELLGPKQNSPLSINLIVHMSPGSWSSWPPSLIDTLALFAPTKLYLYRSGIHALVTEPAGQWALQVNCGTPNGRVDGANVFPARDGDILSLRTGSHPIVAGPETQLAYISAFTNGLEPL